MHTVASISCWKKTRLSQKPGKPSRKSTDDPNVPFVSRYETGSLFGARASFPRYRMGNGRRDLELMNRVPC